MRISKTIAKGLGLLCLGSMLGGCSAYQLGTAGDPPLDSIYIGPVQNETDAAQLIVPLTNALVEEFIADRRVTPTSFESQADAKLLVTLTRMERYVGAADPRDTALGESFRTILHGRASLTKADGTPLFQDRAFRVESTVLAREDLVQAEYQNVPVLTRDLAAKIVRAVVNTW